MKCTYILAHGQSVYGAREGGSIVRNGEELLNGIEGEIVRLDMWVELRRMIVTYDNGELRMVLLGYKGELMGWLATVWRGVIDYSVYGTRLAILVKEGVHVMTKTCAIFFAENEAQRVWVFESYVVLLNKQVLTRFPLSNDRNIKRLHFDEIKDAECVGECLYFRCGRSLIALQCGMQDFECRTVFSTTDDLKAFDTDGEWVALGFMTSDTDVIVYYMRLEKLLQTSRVILSQYVSFLGVGSLRGVCVCKNKILSVFSSAKPILTSIHKKRKMVGALDINRNGSAMMVCNPDVLRDAIDPRTCELEIASDGSMYKHYHTHKSSAFVEFKSVDKQGGAVLSNDGLSYCILT